MKRHFAQFLVAAVLAHGVSGFAWAQAFPSKPVRIVVPYPPGGPMDPLMRSIQAPLGDALGQQVIVENRPGATGLIGMTFCARSAPDGHTLCTVTSDGMQIIPRLRTEMPFDAERDFAPIMQLVHTTTVLVTPPRSPFNDLREMIAYAKANPGKLNFGSFGLGGGTHQLVEMIKKLAGVNIVHVPYKGSGPAVQAAVAGEVDLAASTPQVVGPFLRAGKLKALALAADERNPSLPDLKTYREYGLDIGPGGWFALVAPGNTPKAIIDRLNREIAKIITSPAEREKIRAAFGVGPIANTPEQFAQNLRAGARRADELADLLRAAGYKPE